jgi:hypothetical protein
MCTPSMLFHKFVWGLHVIPPLWLSNSPTCLCVSIFVIQTREKITMKHQVILIVLGSLPNQWWQKKLRVAKFWKYFDRVAIPKSLRTPALISIRRWKRPLRGPWKYQKSTGVVEHPYLKKLKYSFYVDDFYKK